MEESRQQFVCKSEKFSAKQENAQVQRKTKVRHVESLAVYINDRPQNQQNSNKSINAKHFDRKRYFSGWIEREIQSLLKGRQFKTDQGDSKSNVNDVQPKNTCSMAVPKASSNNNPILKTISTKTETESKNFSKRGSKQMRYGFTEKSQKRLPKYKQSKDLKDKFIPLPRIQLKPTDESTDIQQQLRQLKQNTIIKLTSLPLGPHKMNGMNSAARSTAPIQSSLPKLKRGQQEEMVVFGEEGEKLKFQGHWTTRSRKNKQNVKVAVKVGASDTYRYHKLYTQKSLKSNTEPIQRLTKMNNNQSCIQDTLLPTNPLRQSQIYPIDENLSSILSNHHQSVCQNISNVKIIESSSQEIAIRPSFPSLKCKRMPTKLFNRK